MGKTAIQFENVSKRFRRGEKFDSLRDLIPSFTRRVLGRKKQPGVDRDFWALVDISLEIQRGRRLLLLGTMVLVRVRCLSISQGLWFQQREIFGLMGDFQL